MKPPRRVPLRTDRLELWPVEERWAQALWEAAEASLLEISPWMPWARRASRRETQRFCGASRAAWSEGRTFDFVWLDGGRVVGAGGVEFHDPDTRCGEVGYWVRTDAAGNGLGTEGTAAMVRFGFEQVGLHRVELKAGVENRASRRVAEKLGFTLEAERLRDSGLGAGGYYDGALYALVETDPRP
ncbi:MAG TPA: GNAT family protein [Actinomycetota bacterium]|jgi:ribosomal-protein-serine acetyltransferase